MNKGFLFLLLLTGAVAGCTFTVTKQKMPVFGEPMDSLKAELGKMLSAENLSFTGREINENNAKHSELEIDIINGTHIPGEEDRMALMAKAIAMDVKRGLKDTTEYGTYKVIFMTVTTSAGVTARKWRGREFTSTELSH